MKQDEEKKYNAIEKALITLLAFSNERPVWGVRELSQELGFNPATVVRILKTLKEYGFVEQDEKSRHYHLGNILYRFIQPLQNVNRVTHLARRYMESLSLQTRETVHLNILEQDSRVCIDTMESLMPLRAVMPLGNKSPLYAGASAKCLLAFSKPEFIRNYIQTTRFVSLTENTLTEPGDLEKELEGIRQAGYASSLGERTQGLGSLSAPVFDHNGDLVAGLSLAIPEIRFSDESHRTICIRALVEAAETFSSELGHRPRV